MTDTPWKRKSAASLAQAKVNTPQLGSTYRVAGMPCVRHSALRGNAAQCLEAVASATSPEAPAVLILMAK